MNAFLESIQRQRLLEQEQALLTQPGATLPHALEPKSSDATERFRRQQRSLKAQRLATIRRTFDLEVAEVARMLGVGDRTVARLRKEARS